MANYKHGDIVVDIKHGEVFAFSVADEYTAINMPERLRMANIIIGRCSTCKHWRKDKKYDVGRCAALNDNVASWVDAEGSAEIIQAGNVTCEKLFTHPEFGCIHHIILPNP